MEAIVSGVTDVLSTMTLGANIVFVGLILLKWQRKNLNGKVKNFLVMVTDRKLLLAWIVAMTATMGSLFFSEGAGYTPCKLCWLQRIFMYPLAVILGVAMVKKDKKIGAYVLSLAIIGLVIGIYHYYLQLGGSEFVECSTVGYSVSCADNFFTHYGYITIPMMSVSAFALIAVLMSL